MPKRKSKTKRVRLLKSKFTPRKSLLLIMALTAVVGGAVALKAVFAGDSAQLGNINSGFCNGQANVSGSNYCIFNVVWGAYRYGELYTASHQTGNRFGNNHWLTSPPSSSNYSRFLIAVSGPFRSGGATTIPMAPGLYKTCFKVYSVNSLRPAVRAIVYPSFQPAYDVRKDYYATEDQRYQCHDWGIPQADSVYFSVEVQQVKGAQVMIGNIVTYRK